MGKTIKDHYENLIIGFGKGGKTLAAWLANHGRDVAIIEQSDKMYGGACINVACTIFTHPSMTEAFNDLYSLI